MDYYKASDWNITCDSCGKKMKATHTKHRWDGFIVCDSCWEPRHSHDFIKVKYDKQEVPFSRRPQEIFTDVPYVVPLSCTPLSRFPQADFGTADCAVVNTAMTYVGPVGPTYTPETSWVTSTLAVGEARGIGTNGSVFVVAHQNLGDSIVSVGDGTTWSGVALDHGGSYWRAAGGSGGDLCVIGVPSIGTGEFSSLSTDDGVGWTTAADLPSTQSWISIAGSGTAFVAIPAASTNVFARKLNAGSWSGGTLPQTANWADITYADGKFIAVSGNPGYVAVSTDDGASFTVSQATGSVLSLNCITHNGAVWCAVAANGAIITSPTGLAGSWTARRVADGTLTYSVAALDGVFYSPIYGSNNCLYSVDDGVTWLNFLFPVSGSWIDCCSDGTRVVAISGSTTVSTN